VAPREGDGDSVWSGLRSGSSAEDRSGAEHLEWIFQTFQTQDRADMGTGLRQLSIRIQYCY
jgi:hypothetical protein